MLSLRPLFFLPLLSVSLGEAAAAEMLPAAPNAGRGEWVSGRIDALLSTRDAFSGLLRNVPHPLQNDHPTLERIVRLIEPVDDQGLKGSYAGWITRAALQEACVRADAALVESLLLFFQKGGSIRDLESRAARVLPLSPANASGASIGQALWARFDPLGGWRRHRRERLLQSEDPLRFLKLAELRDRSLKLTAGDISDRLGRRQQSAYLRDRDVEVLADQIAHEARDGSGEDAAGVRHKKALDDIAPFLPSAGEDGQRFWPPQVKGALESLKDARSQAVAGRIQKAYALLVPPGGEFEQRVRKRREQEGRVGGKDPRTQNALYFSQSPAGGALLLARSRPVDLPWNVGAEGAFFEVLASIVHEDDHHVRWSTKNYRGTPEERFAFEFLGHGAEFLWRAGHGDPGYLRSLTSENPLGFGLAFRDDYEKRYLPAI